MEQKIGLDSVIIIYLLEENKQYLSQAKSILNKIQSGKTPAVFSAIGIIEISTGPKKLNQYDLANQYRDLIVNFPNLSIIGLNENIVELSSTLRAKYNIATPDAIHIATAIDQNAQKFITNDKLLKKIREIDVKLISELK